MSHRGWIWTGLLLFATLAWGQAEKPANTPAAPKPPTLTPPAATHAPTAAMLPGSAAVITIPGLCDRPSQGKPSPDKAKPADCKTVVTRAEFERLIETVAPTIAPAARKQLATQYGVALVLVHKAH